MENKFKPIPSPFGGVDERATHEAFANFVGGVSRAERLQSIWHNSYANGTEDDRVCRRAWYHSKEEVFRYNALREGFSQEEIKAFLSLS